MNARDGVRKGAGHLGRTAAFAVTFGVLMTALNYLLAGQLTKTVWVLAVAAGAALTIAVLIWRSRRGD